MKQILSIVILCLISFSSVGYIKETLSIRSDIVLNDTIFLFNGVDMSMFYTWLPSFRYDDPDCVFQVVDQIDGAPAIRISGQHYGGLITKNEYSDYKLIAEYKWGDITWSPRKNKTRDAGILLHCNGTDGNSQKLFDSPWQRSVEYQIIEGGTGDMLLVKGFDVGSETPIIPKMKVLAKDEDRIWNPNGELTEFQGGRVDWFGRDLGWSDVLGFRGEKDVENPVGEWNLIEIYCEGGDVTYYLNGIKVNEGREGTLSEGKILFQSEGAEIYFRRIDLIRSR